jgi:GGDEF domain-containing protein
MTEEDQLHALHTAVDCYLSTLLAVANCVGDACPEVGGPYQNRLSRLQSRLAFDSTPEALEESCLAVEAELKEYALKTSAYLAEHGAALRSATAALAEIVGSLGQSPEFCGEREMHSLVLRMQSELAAVERRLKEAEVTDPLTGLMNRREMERRIEAHKDAFGQPVLLQFRITGETRDEIVRQVAARLNVQFRYKDLLSRWSDSDFMVLFQGPPEAARSRVEQILPWVAGRYLMDSGEQVQVEIEVRPFQPALVR